MDILDLLALSRADKFLQIPHRLTFVFSVYRLVSRQCHNILTITIVVSHSLYDPSNNDFRKNHKLKKVKAGLKK